ncbi:anti-sigma-K factor RskA [Nocardiopsis sp. Huas11]|uniref:anti-sigma factor n=1 Tax=Nocardiopsis sp. Huas11 TaxID=2183912 RepID=UPI000EAFA774|nr:anti-sigma factor [Nocardiopsis sp. Huas11]RKS06534.1 anti-sigma-K factor RskA [Nocardiopsis sp. Huas11]
MSENCAHGLIAGYAVDGLDPEEATATERHLAECEDCRRDLVEFRETLVRLAYAESDRPSDAVWTRVRAAAERTRQEAPVVEVPGPGATVTAVPTVLRWRRRLPWLLAAACALAAVVLGAGLVSMLRDMDAMRQESSQVEALLSAPDTSVHEGPLGEGARATAYTSYEMDALMFVVDGLPSAPEGMEYQMWYVDPDDDMRSAGMLKPTEEGLHSGMAKDMGAPIQVGVSLEPEGGMPEPSGQPMKFDL